MKWQDLHDSTLIGIRLMWSEGIVEVDLIYFWSGRTQEGTIQCSGVSRLDCTRNFPWGKSKFINRISIDSADDHLKLAIEMQSGDVLSIQGGYFFLEGIESSDPDISSASTGAR